MKKEKVEDAVKSSIAHWEHILKFLQTHPEISGRLNIRAVMQEEIGATWHAGSCSLCLIFLCHTCILAQYKESCEDSSSAWWGFNRDLSPKKAEEMLEHLREIDESIINDFITYDEGYNYLGYNFDGEFKKEKRKEKYDKK